MTDPSSIQLGPISEIILYVSDMGAQVRFYRDKLGLSIRYPEGLADYANEFWVTFDTGTCVLALHGGGEKDFGKDAPKFVFDCHEIEATHAAFKEEGIPVSEVRTPSPGTSTFDAKDPEGNLFSVESRTAILH